MGVVIEATFCLCKPEWWVPTYAGWSCRRCGCFTCPEGQEPWADPDAATWDEEDRLDL